MAKSLENITPAPIFEIEGVPFIGSGSWMSRILALANFVADRPSQHIWDLKEICRLLGYPKATPTAKKEAREAMYHVRRLLLERQVACLTGNSFRNPDYYTSSIAMTSDPEAAENFRRERNRAEKAEELARNKLRDLHEVQINSMKQEAAE